MAPVSALTKNYKLVFMGDQSVGKTSIITRFLYDKFNDTYKVTIGYDFDSMLLDDRAGRLKIWDTAGHKRFRKIIQSYRPIRDPCVAVIVYDITSRRSFLNVAKWIEVVRTESGSDVIIVLVGNKTDLVDKRKVSIKEAEAKARDLSAMFIETNAKDGFNIKALFRKIITGLAGMETLSSAELDEMVDLNERISPRPKEEEIMARPQRQRKSPDRFADYVPDTVPQPPPTTPAEQRESARKSPREDREATRQTSIATSKPKRNVRPPNKLGDFVSK